MSQVKRKVSRKTAISKADRELRVLARAKFKPWKKSEHLHPTPEEWKNLDNPHGFILRCCHATMMLTKENIVSGFGRDFEVTKDLVESMIDTKTWMEGNVEILTAAIARLMSGLAAAEVEREKKSRRAA